MNKITKAKKTKTEEASPVFETQLHGIQLNFDIDHEKSLIDWRFEKKGRNLSVELFAIVDSWYNYKQLFVNLAGTDFLKSSFPGQGMSLVDDILRLLKTNKLLYDFIIIECTIMYEDENSSSEFVQYSGFAFTVNGRKHLQDETNGISSASST